ncbi:hypothetical protein PVV74_14930 [Roseovarius sp. SK2]|jgi:hypothetical protein|uniref:hypothetical protein n=1 Tax=Roseovarius TaxID=74030 RepID=UPI00237B9838|nr:hypothetical protein [Roseovarius sp. SK2]MDD9726761.1 hypothetical protein [Roseovarius sp. SK2]
MTSAKLFAAALLGLLPSAGLAQAGTLDAATTKCIFDTPGGENLHVTVKYDASNRATMLIRKKPGATDATVQAYRACVTANTTATAARGKLVAPSDPVVVPAGSVKPVRVLRQKSVNALCPPHAPVLYRGTIYCIGNPY